MRSKPDDQISKNATANAPTNIANRETFNR